MKTERKQVGAVVIIALMCMVAFGAIFTVVPMNVQGASWYSDSAYLERQTYSITNPDAVVKTNSVVNVYLTEATTPNIFDECLSNGHDIIFTNWDSTTRLEHYMAYWDYADHDALFQVVVPSIAASADTNIRIYYDNAAATNLSDGDAVFTLFDDFDYSAYRNCTTLGFVGNNYGSIFEKYTTHTYTPSASAFHTSEQKMMGITSVYDNTLGNTMAYGSYMNTSFAAVLGMNNTDGYGTDWTPFTNVMINHSATGASPDFLKATEPDYLTNISDSWHREPIAEYDTDKMTIFYSGLNATNYSINMASSATHDAVWTKYGSNPVLYNGTGTNFDSAGCRKPVVWKDGEADYRMLYAGSTDGLTWKIGYATSSNLVTWSKAHTWSVFNGTGSFGWDNKSVIPLDISHDGTFYELMYAGCDWEDNWRIGYAYTSDSDFITWSTWGGVIGIGDTADWDGHDVNYGTWASDDNARFTAYYTGKNSTGEVQMGYSDVMNSSISGQSSWQHDGAAGSFFFVNAEKQLEVQWNNTMIERAVDLGNYSVTVDMWTPSATGNNASLFMRSDGGTLASSEDSYSLSVNTSDNLMNTLEWTGGTSAVLNQTSFNYTGVYQHMLKIRAYGGSIYTYAEGMDSNNTASGESYDLTIETGEIGLRVDTQPKVKFDNFRTLPATNGTLTVAFGESETWNEAAETGGSTGDDEWADDWDDVDADGLPDDWEQDYFGDLDQDETTDYDGDGYTDFEEWFAGTDPTDPDDYPTDELEDMLDWFEDICGTFWWLIILGIILTILGITRSPMLRGALTTQQAIAIGTLLIANAFALSGGWNWLVIIGSALIVIDYILKIPIPYVQKPIATLIGGILVIFGIVGML